MSTLREIHFTNANSRPTYFTVHRVAEAHRISTGEDVAVGVLDHSFATTKYEALFTAGRDFVGNPTSLLEDDGHGYWMARVLREVAPTCDIFALNVANEDPIRFSGAIVEAIDWAVENGVHVLTCSHGKYVYDAWRDEIDAAVSRAVTRGVATCFLHYDHPYNILTTGAFPYNGHEYNRAPDLNIWQYDYNTLRIQQYEEYLDATEPPTSGNDIPFFSMSSTAAVTGGFVSLLMALQPGLPASRYRDILIETSYSWSYNGAATFEHGEVSRVVDIAAAVERLRSRPD